MSLPQRKLGEFSVSAIGLGCMNLSHAYGVPATPEQGVALLNRALDLGCTMLDTAALYGLGKNERLLGEGVMHRRSEFTLASKCVLDLRDGERVLDGRPETIAKTLDEALARLKTDVIDLYYLHRLDKKVPIEESVGALVRAKEAGKIRALGLSEMSAPIIRRAHAVHPITALQSEFSPMVRNVEIAALGACRELGITLVAFSPVARGLLANGVTDAHFVEGDIRLAMPRFIEPNLSHNLKVVGEYNALAAQIGCTPAQLSLAWVLAKGEDIVPIPGTRSIAHLEENLNAVNVTLSADIVAKIDALFTPDTVHGNRYSAAQQTAQIDTEQFDYELAAA